MLTEHTSSIWAATWENRIFAYAKIKTQISFAVTSKLISAFFFATRIVQSLFFLNTKFQASSHLQWLYTHRRWLEKSEAGNWGIVLSMKWKWAASWENQRFAYAKTKTQISFAVTAKLIRAFVFAIRIVQSLFFLNTKFQASSHLQWLHSLVCVRPGLKPRRPVFSERGPYKVSENLCGLQFGM